MRLWLIPALFATLLLSACATTHVRLENLSIGMTKEEVIKSIGRPNNVRTSFVDSKPPYETKELWEYVQYQYPDGFGYRDIFYIAFHSNHLVKWGRPSDFQSQPNEINEIRFR